MTVEETLKICDEVYLHLVEMNFKFYSELYHILTRERATKAIVEAQIELQKMIRNKQIKDYHKRIKECAI